MDNNRFTIFCHLNQQVNTIIKDPELALVCTENWKEAMMNFNFNFGFGSSKGSPQKVTSDYRAELAPANLKSLLPVPYPGYTKGAHHSAWMIKPCAKAYGKYYLVSEFDNRPHYLTNNASIITISDEFMARAWEIIYYPSDSNNTYLICLDVASRPVQKYYLTMVKGSQGYYLAFTDKVEVGSVWGFQQVL